MYGLLDGFTRFHESGQGAEHVGGPVGVPGQEHFVFFHDGHDYYRRYSGVGNEGAGGANPGVLCIALSCLSSAFAAEAVGPVKVEQLCGLAGNKVKISGKDRQK